MAAEVCDMGTTFQCWLGKPGSDKCRDTFCGDLYDYFNDVRTDLIDCETSPDPADSSAMRSTCPFFRWKTNGGGAQCRCPPVAEEVEVWVEDRGRVCRPTPRDPTPAPTPAPTREPTETPTGAPVSSEDSISVGDAGRAGGGGRGGSAGPDAPIAANGLPNTG